VKQLSFFIQKVEGIHPSVTISPLRHECDEANVKMLIFCTNFTIKQIFPLSVRLNNDSHPASFANVQSIFEKSQDDVALEIVMQGNISIFSRFYQYLKVSKTNKLPFFTNAFVISNLTTFEALAAWLSNNSMNGKILMPSKYASFFIR